ncbi:MAG: hypothetical protein KAJ16_06860 [Calditrichia bacterium]|nr:hypothetical protein [Calditrichia bacterium]
MEQVVFLLMGSLLTVIGFWIKWYFRRREQYDRYRTASIEKRLECHQRAFALTYEIQKGATTEKHQNIFNKCHQWWSENTFYLEPQTRKAFQECYWQLLLFNKGNQEPQIIEKRLNFNKSTEPQTRKIISEEIGIPFQEDNSNSGNGKHGPTNY